MGQVISTFLSWFRALKKGKGRQNDQIFPVTACSTDVSSLWQQNSRSFLDSFADSGINVKDSTTVCNDATINSPTAFYIIDVVVDPSTKIVEEEHGSLPCQEERKFVVLEEEGPPIGGGFGEVEVVISKEDFIERPTKLKVEEIIRRKGPSSYEDFGINVKDSTTICNDATINSPTASHIIDVVVDPSTIIVEEEHSSLPCQEEREFVVLEEEGPPIGGGFGKVEVVISKEDFIERPRKLKVEEIIRRKGPYTSSQKMLLVGEGDFSFSACLAVAFGSAANMVATSLDSMEFLLKNYKKANSNILQLKIRGCTVMHGIDATEMASRYSLDNVKFDRIIFNFPHAGVFGRDPPRDSQIRIHQRLIRWFLKNAKKMIAVDGEIHITHKSNGFFREWAIETLAVNEGLQLIEEFRFNHRDYEGYSTKFGFGGDGFFNCNPSKTYIFAFA